MLKWVAVDADHKRAITNLPKLHIHLRRNGVKSVLEKLHPGGHLWKVLAEPLPVQDGHFYVYGLV
jgi:hypothetical protein